MAAPLIPEALPPQGQEAPDLQGDPAFANLPPELQAALMEMIQHIMQTGQLPPELAGAMGGMPQQGPPQGMPPMGPPGGMPMPPQGAMPGGSPGGGAPMPGPAMGMEEGGPVKTESMENIHEKIEELKQKLKKKEQEIKEKYAPKKPGSQEGPPRHPLLMQAGGNVPPGRDDLGAMLDTPISNPPPDWWTGTAYEWERYTHGLQNRLNQEVWDDFAGKDRRPIGAPARKRGGLGPQAEGVFEGGRSPLSKMPGGRRVAGELDDFIAKNFDVPPYGISGEDFDRMVSSRGGPGTGVTDVLSDEEWIKAKGHIPAKRFEGDWGRDPSVIEPDFQGGSGIRPNPYDQYTDSFISRNFDVPPSGMSDQMWDSAQRGAITDRELSDSYLNAPVDEGTDVTRKIPFTGDDYWPGDTPAPRPSPFRYQETGATDLDRPVPGWSPRNARELESLLEMEGYADFLNEQKINRPSTASLVGTPSEINAPGPYSGEAYPGLDSTLGDIDQPHSERLRYRLFPHDNPYLDKPSDVPFHQVAQDISPLQRRWEELKQTPKYQGEIAGETSKFLSPQAKAARGLGAAMRSAPGRAIPGLVGATLGPGLAAADLYRNLPEESVMDTWSPTWGSLPAMGDRLERAGKTAGLEQAMMSRPQAFAEPHMGPPRPELLYDEAGYVAKKSPGSWGDLPQDPFQKYADMPSREWEREMGYGVGEVRRGVPYGASPLEFWNRNLYFPKTKEDLSSAWNPEWGPIPKHLRP